MENEKYIVTSETTWKVVCRQANGAETVFEVTDSKEKAEAAAARKNAEVERLERSANALDARGDKKRGR